MSWFLWLLAGFVIGVIVTLIVGFIAIMGTKIEPRDRS